MAYFIGLMSGTSMDGVDAVLCEFDHSHIQTLHAVSLAYPGELLKLLHALCSPGDNEINQLGQADIQVARVFARAVDTLLQQAGLKPEQITAIGSHGQTIRHCPPEKQPGFTLQIGDPNTLAALTGIDVVADFRRKDMALGGQGAPLAPGFHQAVFQHPTQSRVVLNIGGIANVTLLPAAQSDQPVVGFDTGPGNTLMDAWCRRHTGQTFDKDGLWAESGKVSEDLLAELLNEPYFKLPYPKSTGRETFHLHWLDGFLAGRVCQAEDIQATLLALTTQSIANALSTLPQVQEAFICGGGAYNPLLMQGLAAACPGTRFSATDALGIDPQQVEGAAFAWLAWAHIHRRAGNLPSVTGASRAAVLGTLCLAS